MRGSGNNEYRYNSPVDTNVHTDWSALSKQYCANPPGFIKQWYKRNMESFSNHHFNSRNNNIYLHTFGKLRCSCNHEYCDYSTSNSNICSDWTTLSKQPATIVTWYFSKWYKWCLESFEHQ